MKGLSFALVCLLNAQSAFGFVTKTPSIQTSITTSKLSGLPQSQVRERKHELKAAFLNPPKRKASKEWINNLISLPNSIVLRSIQSHLWANTIWALALTYLVESDYLEIAKINPLPHTLTTGVIGLLLVFRTNSGYDRFWEGRKIWGAIVNTIRNAGGTVQAAVHEKHHEEFAKYINAFPYTLKQRLQLVRDDKELMEQCRFTQEECDMINDSGNPPLFVAQKLREMIGTCEYKGLNSQREEIFFRIRMENIISMLVDFHGMCERILMTPVPMSYTRHTSRALSIFCLTLPFVMIPVVHWVTPIAMLIICWGLFSLEEIGLLIEQPFDIKGDSTGDGSLLLLTNYCRVMKTDIDNVLLGKKLKGLFDPTYVPPSERTKEEQEVEVKEAVFGEVASK